MRTTAFTDHTWSMISPDTAPSLPSPVPPSFADTRSVTGTTPPPAVWPSPVTPVDAPVPATAPTDTPSAAAPVIPDTPSDVRDGNRTSHADAHTRERTVEKHFVSACRTRGLFTVKFTAPSSAGVPDRVIIGFTPDGDRLTGFVELKRPGGKTRPLQDATIADMVSHGATVAVADSADAVDDLLDTWFGTGPQPTAQVLPVPDPDDGDAGSTAQTAHGRILHPVDPFDLSA